MSLIPQRWRDLDPKSRRAKSREAAELIVEGCGIGCMGIALLVSVGTCGSIWLGVPV